MSSPTLDTPPTHGDHALQVPSTPAFSFKARLPTSSSSETTSSTAAGPKQRRVSLALPSSTRVAWNFRDDTGIESHVPETGASDLVPEKWRKMRRIAPATDNEAPHEKKQRKKWSDEETQMLVTGCNMVSCLDTLSTILGPHSEFSTVSETGRQSSAIPTSGLTTGRQSISKTGASHTNPSLTTIHNA